MLRCDGRVQRFLRRNMSMVMIALLWMDVSSAMSQDTVVPLNTELVAKAMPDECFYDIGSWDNTYNHADLTEQQIQECLDGGGTLKRNAGYLWGITQSQDALWFGTAANITEARFGAILERLTSEGNFPYERIVPTLISDDVVFELDESTFMDGELGFLGDYRPPRVFAYDLKTGELTDHTPDDPLLYQTHGLRSAGYLNGVAILAGPVLYNDNGLKGINLFAFDTITKTYLGSRNIRDLTDDRGNITAESITNIRKWLEINGVLYTSVGTEKGGKVLRWRGSAADPFRFQVVGDLEDQGAELVYHENRLFILTWPPSEGTAGFNADSSDFSNVADIMMSKIEIPEGGLTANTEFVSVWNVRNYEPDMVTAATYGLGAAASYDGYLYWGTINVPGASAMTHFSAYPKDALSLRSIILAISKTYRKSALFRGKNFATGNPDIELLYGDEFLYQYRPERLRRNKWVSVPNTMEQEPLLGESGFGGLGDFYTWAMAVYKDQLFIGTAEPASATIPDAIRKIVSIPDTEPGFNLYRFTDSKSPAIIETDNGFGRDGAYGIRNLIVADDALFLGTASSFNLNPTGGWSLTKITISDQTN